MQSPLFKAQAGPVRRGKPGGTLGDCPRASIFDLGAVARPVVVHIFDFPFPLFADMLVCFSFPGAPVFNNAEQPSPEC